MSEGLKVCLFGFSFFVIGYAVGTFTYPERYHTGGPNLETDIIRVEPGDTIISDFGGFSYNVVLEMGDGYARVKRIFDWGEYETIMNISYILEEGFLHKRKK